MITRKPMHEAAVVMVLFLFLGGCGGARTSEPQIDSSAANDKSTALSEPSNPQVDSTAPEPTVPNKDATGEDRNTPSLVEDPIEVAPRAFSEEIASDGNRPFKSLEIGSKVRWQIESYGGSGTYTLFSVADSGPLKGLRIAATIENMTPEISKSMRTSTTHLEGEFAGYVNIPVPFFDGTSPDLKSAVAWMPYVKHGRVVLSEPFRIWTDASGKHPTEAQLLDERDGKIFLKRKDTGAEISIPQERLSERDQKYAKGRTSALREANSSKGTPNGSGATAEELFAKVIAAAGVPATKEAEELVQKAKNNVSFWQSKLSRKEDVEPAVLVAFTSKYIVAALVEKTLGKPDRKTEDQIFDGLFTLKGEKMKGPVYWYGTTGFHFGNTEIDGKQGEYLMTLRHEAK